MPSSIYIAGPLFTLAEREWIGKLATFLQNDPDMSVFVPHEECIGLENKPKEIFNTCKQGVDQADTIVAILDGPDADSGTCWEVGYAFAKNKTVIGVRTDFRLCEMHHVNIMLHYGVTTLIGDTKNNTEHVFSRILEEIRRLS